MVANIVISYMYSIIYVLQTTVSEYSVDKYGYCHHEGLSISSPTLWSHSSLLVIHCRSQIIVRWQVNCGRMLLK